MAKVLNETGMARLTEISDKYRFRNFYDLESDEVISFCRAFLGAVDLGLNPDEEDVEDIREILDTLAMS